MHTCHLDRLESGPGLGHDVDVLLVTEDHGDPPRTKA